MWYGYHGIFRGYYVVFREVVVRVITEKVTSFEDKSVHDGVIVSHVFRTDEDGRRMTQFYMCSDQKQAHVLMTSLIKNTEECLLSLLKLIHDDLLMRAETDEEGRKVVDISGFIWVKIKQALNEVKSDVDNMQN